MDLRVSKITIIPRPVVLPIVMLPLHIRHMCILLSTLYFITIPYNPPVCAFMRHRPITTLMCTSTSLLIMTTTPAAAGTATHIAVA